MTYSRPLLSTFIAMLLGGTMLLTASCASNMGDMPQVDVPPAEQTSKKFAAVNRKKQNPVVYIKLDDDVLRPTLKTATEVLPQHHVGPFELRNETLAAALELVMGGQRMPIAIQTPLATERMITVTGLEGPFEEVIDKLCGLADLYCLHEKGTMLIKEKETFSVSLPPFIAESYDPFVQGLQSITGGDAYVDSLTRTLSYTASHRNHKRAEEYFNRLRANTALIVYEIQIWEVNLSNEFNTGIDWEQFAFTSGDFALELLRDGTAGITGASGIGAQIMGSDVTVDAVLSFLHTQGAVKTISQPQLTVLSGSSAKLRVGNSRDYVSQITRTVGISAADNVSVTTSKLETGLNMEIASAWDNSTVYGDLKITVQNLLSLGALEVGTTSIQLPETSDRSLETKLRVRPGDAVIIAGIVEERNEINQQGPPSFWDRPLFATQKETTARNSELVFMLRPRVVVYTDTLPDGAQLQTGGMRMEPSRVQNTPAVLPSAPTGPTMLTPTPLSSVQDSGLESYLTQLSPESIAPAE